MEMSTDYWLGKYLYSGAITWLCSLLDMYNSAFQKWSVLMIFFLCFPLSLYLWDNLFNNSPTLIIMPISLVLIWKITKTIMLYALSPLIAPIILLTFFFHFIIEKNKNKKSPES